MNAKSIIWVAVATICILMIPFIAMQFSAEVSWELSDFIIAGALLFCAGCLFAFLAQGASTRRKLIAGAIILLAVAYIWAELAVGVFTNLGS